MSFSVSYLKWVNFEFYYSDQSWISDIQNNLKLNEKEGVYYEYYVRSDENNELFLVNKRVPVKELGDIYESKVKYD